MGILLSSKPTPGAEGEENQAAVEEDQDINDSGRAEGGSGGSGPERLSLLDMGGKAGEVSCGNGGFGGGEASESGLVETCLLELRMGRSVDRLESISSNEKRALCLSSGTEGMMSGVNGGGVEENESSLDRIEEEDTEGGNDDSIEEEDDEESDDGLDGIEEEEEEEEDSDWMPEADEGHEFSVGDFVWGKIKSHPWWPAQIYDPSDASEYAERLKPKDGRLLVAYFGDGTFAWCHSSQLKPFEEHFQEMSKQSSAKAFVNAVQQAVDEIGRLVMLKMSCSCVRKDFLDGFSQPLALNAGIKEGVLVPEGRVGKLWDRLSEPADILANLKHAAQVVSVPSVLELAGLESWVSAFYYSKGGYHLPAFVEARPIPGLEEDWKAVDVSGVVQGPCEDWMSSPKRNKTGQTLLQTSPDTFDKRQYHRRKQKSIADLMGGEDDIKARTKDVAVREEAKPEKPGSSSGRKTRKGSESHDKSSLTSESEKKRFKLSKSPASARTKKVSSFENDYSGSKEEPKKVQLSRRRKKDEGIGIDSSDVETKEETGDVETKDGELQSGGSQSDMKDHIETRTLSRERKRSRYLCYPFTTLNMGRNKEEIDTEETTSGAASDIIGSPRMLNRCTKTSGGSSPKTPAEDENKRIYPTKAANASPSLVLSDVRSAAVHPSLPINEKSWDIVVDFVSMFRDSVYSNGSNYENYKNHQPHKKRKDLKSEHGSLEKDLSHTVAALPESDSGKKKVKLSQETTKSDKPPQKQAAETPSSEPRRRRSKLAAGKKDDKPSPPSLFVTFGPGSSLPTKADLIRIYSPFGELDEAETEMFYNNFCARVCFMRSSDAEVAFKHSENDSPFGASNVNFRLHNLSAVTKVRELSEISKSPQAKASSNTKTQPPAVGESSQVDLIKQKLQKMTSMLESPDGSVSAKTKSKLESEIKELLETVSTIRSSSS